MRSQNPWGNASMPGNFEPWSGLVECQVATQCYEAAGKDGLRERDLLVLETRIDCRMFRDVGVTDETLVPKSYCTCSLELVTSFQFLGKGCQKRATPPVFVPIFFWCIWLVETGFVAHSFFRLWRASKLGMLKYTRYRALHVLSGLTLFSIYVVVSVSTKVVPAEKLKMDLELQVVAIICVGLACIGYVSTMLLLLQVFRISRSKSALKNKGRKVVLPLDLKIAMIILDSGLILGCILTLIPGTNLYMETSKVLFGPVFIAGVILAGFIVKEAKDLSAEMRKVISEAHAGGWIPTANIKLEMTRSTIWKFTKYTGFTFLVIGVTGIVQNRLRKDYMTVRSPNASIYLFGQVMFLFILILFTVPTQFVLGSFYNKIGFREKA